MLKDSLYKIKALTPVNGGIHATLEINEHHDILKGHFPGQPVLPGACMLQIVKEVLETVLAKSFQLKKASNIKFLQVIDPQKNNLLDLNLSYQLSEDNLMQVTAGLLSGEAIYFKFQGVFK